MVAAAASDDLGSDAPAAVPPTTPVVTAPVAANDGLISETSASFNSASLAFSTGLLEVEDLVSLLGTEAAVVAVADLLVEAVGFSAPEVVGLVLFFTGVAVAATGLTSSSKSFLSDFQNLLIPNFFFGSSFGCCLATGFFGVVVVDLGFDSLDKSF